MCGVVGSVGVSKNPVTSYNLLTNLLRETKRRGPHATGHYFVDLEGKVHTHKSPTPADIFVRGKQWKHSIHGHRALMGHARFTTHGSEDDNRNNHPFVSKSGNIAIVHNGVLFLYDEHKHKYRLQSECDSELILRIITGEKSVLRGIKKVFSLLGPGGDFACEVIHNNPQTGKADFYFFRDSGRPGRMLDLREELGQLMFCSETAIWKDAIRKAGLGRRLHKIKTTHVPEYEIWQVDSETLKIKKHKVKRPIKVPRYKFNRRGITHQKWTSNTTYSTKPYSSHMASGDDHDDLDYGGSGVNWKDIYGPGAGMSGPPMQSQEDESLEDIDINDPAWDIDVTEADDGSQMASYIFDPNYKGKDKSEWEQLVLDAIVSPDKRYFGWEDDAILTGLLTEAEVKELSELEDDKTDEIDKAEIISIEDLNIDPSDSELDAIAADEVESDDINAELRRLANTRSKKAFDSLEESVMGNIINDIIVNEDQGATIID